MPTKSQKRRAEMAQKAYGTVMDMGHVLRASRLACGLNIEYIAQCMNTTRKEWIGYEQNHEPIPGHIIIKLMIFGMDFWVRNKQCFEYHYPVRCASIPSPDEGELNTNN